MNEAEKLKKLYGNAIVTLIPEGNEVEVPSVGRPPFAAAAAALAGRNSRAARARTVRNVARSHAAERHVRACIAGLVLSGGGSRLPGLIDIAESVLRKPVRLAWPVPLAKMPVELAEPEFATALGMVYYGHRARVARGIQDDRWSSRLKAMFARRALRD